MDSNINQFLTLAILKGQLDEIYDAINTELISKISSTELKKTEKLQFNKTVKVQLELRVTNVQRNPGAKLVIEELNRLRTLVDSLASSIVMMEQVAGLEYNPPPDNGAPPTPMTLERKAERI